MKLSKFILTSISLVALSIATQAQVSNKKTKPFTHAELSVKEDGQWIDGKRGHKEYSGGAFKSVNELTLPAEHTDHTYYIRYEGPGLENNQIAYRIYLDWRNALDIFGKKVDTLVLPYVGQEDFERYHHDAPWGQDIFKAGKTLGIGSFGRYNPENDEVVHFKKVNETTAKVFNEKKKSFVTIDYKGWQSLNDQIDLSAQLSIFPRDRFLKIDLNPSQKIENLCTGIANFKDIPLIKSENNNQKWKYIATYGKQTVAGKEDLLGLVIFYNNDQVQEIKETPNNHLILFKPSTEISYYISATWDKEKNAVKSQSEFIKYINDQVQILNKKGKL